MKSKFASKLFTHPLAKIPKTRYLLRASRTSNRQCLGDFLSFGSATRGNEEGKGTGHCPDFETEREDEKRKRNTKNEKERKTNMNE